MNSLLKYLGFATLTVAIYTPVFALQQKHSAEQYTLIAMKDCQVAGKMPMNGTQLDAYLALKEHEGTMQALSMPVREIEAQIKTFTDEITSLTKEAIQENDDEMYINKALLREQQFASEALQNFMDQQQHHFDALTDHADVIALAAETFEESLEETLEDIDYDQVRVLGPESDKGYPSCVTRL